MFGTADAAAPAVVQVTVSRIDDGRSPVEVGGDRFAVRVHQEASALAWGRPVVFTFARQREVTALVTALHEHSLGLRYTRPQARALARRLGRVLAQTFLGRTGCRLVLERDPGAVLFGVDERVLDLPWELIDLGAEPLVERVAFGRVVTARRATAAPRPLVDDDRTIHILAVGNAGEDLPATASELAAIEGLAGHHHGMDVVVEVLRGKRATRRRFVDEISGHAPDIIHFAGHAGFLGGRPGESSIAFADGPLHADDVARLPWAAPPYVVFSSACQSARAGMARRLVSRGGRANGLAAAFLAAGSRSYLGHYWPVDDAAAAILASELYRSLFELRNVGAALLRARQAAANHADDDVPFAAIGAVFIGDAGTSHRSDLTTAT